MKKIKIILIAVIVILLISIAVVFSLIEMRNRRFEILDDKRNITIVFDNVATNHYKWWDRKFTARNIDVFEKKIKGKDYYLYSIEKDGSRSQSDTGKFLLYKNKHYFVLEREEKTDQDGSTHTLYRYNELFANVGNSHTVYIPFVIDNSNTSLESRSVSVKWSDTAGFSCFEDLKEFYGRFDDEYYSIDEENKCINLNALNGFKDAAKLIVTDDGVTLTID